MSAPAAAQEAETASCHAYSSEDLSLENADRVLDWRCDNSGWLDGEEVTWLRFSGWEAGEPPLLFSSRITVFDSIAIAAVENGVIQQQERYSNEDARPRIAGPVFSLWLPEANEQTDAFIVRIARPHAVTIASEATVTRDPHGSAVSPLTLMLLATVAGMLIMPLLFDGMFFMVLRERFVLLHAAMTCAMLTYVLTTGGVLHGFAEVPVALLAILGPLSWAIGGGLGGLFLLAFMEDNALPRWMRRIVLATSWWTIIVPGFCALQLDATQSFDNWLYFIAMGAAIPVYCIAIVTALFRGSKAARFLFAAWLPVLAASLDRLLRGMGYYSAPASVDQALFLALALEVMIIALGVASRFLAVRQERDRALNQAKSLVALSERDPMTGLFNRRAVEERFDLLRAEGFTCFALLDLDHFKAINDSFGHGVGDDVLRAVARALQPDDNTIAVRMGGEEFALLLRGRKAAERAENRRRAIVRQVAEATRIDRPVTASMGMVEAPKGALADADFEKIYRRADSLLYEAKAAGRNRTMSERLQVFHPRNQSDRRAAA